MNKQIEKFIVSFLQNPENHPLELLIAKNDYNSLQKLSNEQLLQIYFHLHKNEILPGLIRLISFEQPIYKNRSDYGKFDFLYLTQEDKLQVIETKFIDIGPKPTIRSRRKTKRKLVVEQALKRKNRLHLLYGIPYHLIEIAIFTTDIQFIPKTRFDIKAYAISLKNFVAWKRNLEIIINNA